LSYAYVVQALETKIEFPFIVGNPFSRARLIEVIVHKGDRLAEIEMILRAEPVRERGPAPRVSKKTLHGVAEGEGHWKLTHPVARVGFATKPGESYRMTLTLTTPKKLDLKKPAILEIFQRNDRRRITGGVQLQLVRARAEKEVDEQSREPVRKEELAPVGRG
jgi:hypothetical protein